MTISQMAPFLQGIIRILLVLCFWGFFAESTSSVIFKVDRKMTLVLIRYTVFTGFISLFCSLNTFNIYVSHIWYKFYIFFSAINSRVYFVFVIFNFYILFHVFNKIREWRNSNINSTSVVEAINQFPAGVAFFHPNGMPLLINNAMEDLYETVTGEAISDGKIFMDLIRKAADDNGVVSYNGKSYVVNIENQDYNNNNITHIYTTDITDEISQYKLLMDNNKKLSYMQKNLRDLSARIVNLTREEEILNAKVRIHNRMGHLLILSKVYLEDRGGEDKKSILSKWRENFSLFNSDSGNNSSMDNPSVKLLYELRANYNIQLNWTGTLPENQAILRTELFAVGECLSNASKHAKATVLNVLNKYIDDISVIEISNNGLLPEKIIAEGGGLSNIRRRTEAIGGIMEIRTDDEFCIKLIFN